MAYYSTGGLPILIITLILAHVVVTLPTIYNHGTFGPFITLFPHGSAGHKQTVCHGCDSCRLCSFRQCALLLPYARLHERDVVLAYVTAPKAPAAVHLCNMVSLILSYFDDVEPLFSLLHLSLRDRLRLSHQCVYFTQKRFNQPADIHITSYEHQAT